MDDKSRDSIEEIIIDDDELGSDLDDDEPLMTMDDLEDESGGQRPKRRSISERKGTPFKRVTFACDVDDDCDDDDEDIGNTSQDQMVDIDAYITQIITSASQDLLMDHYVEQMVQTVMEAVHKEITPDPDVDVDVDEYVRRILDEAVADLRLDKEIEEYITCLLYHVCKEFDYPQDVTGRESLYSKMALPDSPEHIKQKKITVRPPDRKMAPGTVAHDPHHTDRSADALVQLPGRTCYVNRLPRWRSRSKIGSLDNINHIPDGGERRVFNERPQWNTHSKVGSLDYLDHTPGGGDVVLPKNDVRWRAKSKINSLSSLRIEKRLLRELELYEDCITARRATDTALYKSEMAQSDEELSGDCDDYSDDFEEEDEKERRTKRVRWAPNMNDNRDTTRVKESWKPAGRRRDAQYRPSGKDVLTQQNMGKSDKPEGSRLPALQQLLTQRNREVKAKLRRWRQLKQRSAATSVQEETQYYELPVKNGKVSVHSKLGHNERVSWNANPKVGSLDNIYHQPRYGHFRVPSQKFIWGSTSLIGSHDHICHKPPGGEFPIPTHREKRPVQSKIGSLQNIHHLPVVTDKKVFTEKQNWNHVQSRLGRESNANVSSNKRRVQTERYCPNHSGVSSRI